MGIREWRDITHEEGRWNTEKEMQKQYGVGKDSVEIREYNNLTKELDGDKWKN